MKIEKNIYVTADDSMISSSHRHDHIGPRILTRADVIESVPWLFGISVASQLMAHTQMYHDRVESEVINGYGLESN